MKTDPTDGKPGLRIETAASVVLRDAIGNHAHTFGHVIMHDRAAGQAVVAAYIDGLAGAMAFVIAGGHASLEDMTQGVGKKLTEALHRDLTHLRRK